LMVFCMAPSGADGSTGDIPADVPGIAKKAQVVFIPHAYFLRFDTQGKISRLDAYWDNTVLNSIKPSAV
jgi:hypothetical protein